MSAPPKAATDLLGAAHGRLVHPRRVRALAISIAPLLEPGWSVLDVGCGDGLLAARIAERVAGIEVRGYDTRVRPETAVPVARFDGARLPEPDGAFDAVLLIDTLHHAADPMALLREARRVARRALVVKDHRTARPLAWTTLSLMDRVGNRRHGVALPYHYWSEREWEAAWSELGWEPDHYRTRLGLYPWPASLLFERGLHFLARIVPRGRGPWATPP